MKINESFISIPPYLSVSWKEIVAIQMKETDLLIQLKNGKTLAIPHLEQEAIDAIFAGHQNFLEQEITRFPLFGFGKPASLPPSPIPFDPLELLELPIAFKIGTPEGVISAMGHNPMQSKSPDLPAELLSKIAGVTKIIGANAVQQLPQGIPDCNCFFCQIMNRLQKESHLMSIDEPVSEEDLKFKEWTILQTGDKLFSVENPLDSAEKYSVYLGHPVGCTCGIKGCEHIIAVLKS